MAVVQYLNQPYLILKSSTLQISVRKAQALTLLTQITIFGSNHLFLTEYQI